MTRTWGLKGGKVREILRRLPLASDRALAKLLVIENPRLFTLSQARYMIAYHQGKINTNGKKCFDPIIRKHNFSSKNNFGRDYSKYNKEIHTKILILDIETAPLLSFVWGIWEQNINAEAIVTDWFILTWSAKWLFKNKIYSARLTSKEALRQDDKRIMASIWTMLNEADIVITHNGDKFDIKKLNTRFLIHGMNPPLPYISIDTLKSNRKQFAHTSNKLDYINKSLNEERKMDHEGFPLWVKCYRGDPIALKIMEKYNVQDVVILEDLYLRIRQWIKPHPNLSLHITNEEIDRCPTCMSDNIRAEKKNYYTKTARYEAFRCLDCGAVGRHRNTIIGKQRAKHIKISV